ncbi:SRPBCC domain-containing protein [Vibrio sp. SM6]|uniref:SRPBCC domain-containing protein n=1 Tax=Vibrio agarilyticus TaxID=2726741 RepID=A0A7X8YFX2_9VIBR|nr:SRPBCC domain-containing protein [Vibrio agarilyticus]NLS11801.1 SRPBCC domain-containing protein [Vibrio agarilyticus]
MQETLCYQIEISATPQCIWRMLTEVDCYEKWAQVISPHSTFKGQWRVGGELVFSDAELGGSKVIIDEYIPNQSVEFHHVEMIMPLSMSNGDAIVNRTIVEQWIGSRERYQLVVLENSVLLTITVTTHNAFSALFDSGWQQALPLIKQLCESQE